MGSMFEQRLQYTTRLQQGEAPEAIFDDLVNLLQSVEAYTDRNSYQQALDVYAQVIDAHLAAHDASLIALFDRAIAEFLPQLDILLAEASSLIISEPSQSSDLSASNVSHRPMLVTMSPLLTTEVRCGWLERLFALWLKCIDRYQVSEQLQQILFEVAWSEDIPFLRTLVEAKLRYSSANTHLGVGGFAKESYTSALEKFLKQLPQ